MLFSLSTTAILLFAYGMGSLSTAIIVCRLMGLPDPRTQGSQNPGATNVLRIGGKVPAVLTLAGDVLKGVIPVLLAALLKFKPEMVGLVAFAAFLGHLFPVFFHFQGGKGVATALGGLIALNGPTGIACIATWLLIATLFRYSSLASLITFVLAPVYIGWFTGNLFLVLIIAIMGLILALRHHRNIVKLMKGEESKIGGG